MHELSIAMSILDLAEQESARLGDARILEIHVKLGPLSGVVRGALVSAYELAREGTRLESAELIVQEVPVRIHCPVCNVSQPAVSAREIRCAECGAPADEILSGRELELVAMEIQ
jgi:hydrogenase nickel incorporation protein HypA/HybF